MNNPFEALEARLIHIEELLLDLKSSTPKTTLHENEDQLLTIQEASEFLKLTVPTLYTKVSRSELPVMKRSKRLYFSKKELIEYLKKGRKLTNSDAEKEAELYIKNRT